MLSVFNKKFSKIGAMYNHLKVGHGVKSLSATSKYFGLNIITLFGSFENNVCRCIFKGCNKNKKIE